MTCSESSRPVLLIEDDPLLGLTMKRRIEAMPAFRDVRHVGTCAEAESVWAGLNPRLVLADYRLPDGWGSDVVSGMRKRGYRTPVIMMTGEAEAIPADTVRALDLVAVLTKPVEDAALQACLSALPVCPDPVPTHPRGPRRIGRFRMLALSADLTARHVQRLTRGAGACRWLGLVVPSGIQIRPDGLSALRVWAGQLSADGGRLVLVVDDPDRRRLLVSQCDDWVDVLDTPERLATEGSRLMGRAERRRILHVAAAESRSTS